MTLLAASVRKTASEAASGFVDATNTVAMTTINTAAATEIARNGNKVARNKVTLDLDADLDTANSIPDILISGESNVSMMDIERTLIAASYRIHYRKIRTREGKPDKIKLQVAWN